MLKIKNLSVSYDKKKQVIKDLDLELNEGLYVMIGENGSGKTTLIKAICGILPYSGEITVDGMKPGDKEYGRKLSYLPQLFDVYPALRVREVLEFIAGLRGVPKGDITAAVSEAAKRADVSDFMNERVKKCSEGMRRRVGIAAALLGSPSTVILDEPTAGVDPKERTVFYNAIRSCFKEKTVLISTHILDDVDFLADYVIMLAKGDVAYIGPYSEFIHGLDGKLYELKCTPEAARELRKSIKSSVKIRKTARLF